MVVVIISARITEKKFFGAPTFSVVPTQFLMELGAQPSKLNNSVTSNLLGYITVSLFAK